MLLCFLFADDDGDDDDVALVVKTAVVGDGGADVDGRRRCWSS